jgi:hypothetical protein
VFIQRVVALHNRESLLQDSRAISTRDIVGGPADERR